GRGWEGGERGGGGVGGVVGPGGTEPVRLVVGEPVAPVGLEDEIDEAAHEAAHGGEPERAEDVAERAVGEGVLAEQRAETGDVEARQRIGELELVEPPLAGEVGEAEAAGVAERP